MALELRLAKCIMKISTSLNTFLKKFSRVEIHFNKGIKESWNLLFTTNKEVINTKDEGLFLALTGTFQDESI